MPFSLEIQQEIRVLALFNPDSALEGIKVHRSADEEAIAATQRLYDKGLITQLDGGYLTPLGQEALRYLASFMTILASETEAVDS